MTEEEGSTVDPTDTARSRLQDQRAASPGGLQLWMPMTAVALLLVAASRQVARPLTDPDVWWHLRLGQDFLDGRSLQEPGQLTPFALADWVPTQWLPEVIAATAEQQFGLPGVAWIFGLLLLAFVVGMYLLCRRDAGTLAAALAVAIAFVGASGSLSPRPQMLTYLFLIGTLWAWRGTIHDLKPRWWLVPMTWVWACSHGMWFIGAATGLMITLGLILDGRARGRTAGLLVLVPIGSVLAAALTPVGPRLLTAPFAVQGISEFIVEWAPPDFTDLQPASTAAMIGVVVVALLRRPVSSWTTIAVIVMAGGWTLLYARTVTLGAILIAPLLAQTVQTWLPDRGERERVRRSECAAVLSAAMACLLALAVILPRTSAEPGAVPSGLNALIEDLPEGTVVLNEYKLGGWLLWEHRHVVPVIDGLTESYEPAHLEAHMNTRGMAPGWRDTVDKWGPDAALLAADSPLRGGLEDQLEWTLLGESGGYVLLERE